MAYGHGTEVLLNWCMETPLPHLPGVDFRPAAPDDLPQLAALLNAAHPQSPTTPEDIRRLDALRQPGEAFGRTLALRGGELVGLAETAVPRSENYPGWFLVEVAVQPGEWDGPLPATLLWHAEAFALAHGGHTLLTRVKESWPEKRLYEAHGYAEHDRLWNSVLDLRTLDFGLFPAPERTAAAAGVTIRTLSELGGLDTEAQQRKLYALFHALLSDVPSATPISVWPFELWQKRYVPNLKHPEGIFLAVTTNGEWVGLTELHTPRAAQPQMLQNGLTGVRREWRGRGLGLALKLVAARAGLERGFTHARTNNHSVNRPMLGINEALGFVRDEATVTLKREVLPRPAQALHNG